MKRETIERLANEVGATLTFNKPYVCIHREGKPPVTVNGYKKAYNRLYKRKASSKR